MKLILFLKKRLLKSTILLLTVMLLLPQIASAQDIKLSIKNQKLSEVLKMIQSQTSYKFAYNNSIIDADQLVSIGIESSNINEVLSKLFNDTSIGYKINNNQIILFKKQPIEKNKKLVVSGILIDANTKEPLAYASVQIKGSLNGTSTDADGKFVIEAYANSTLVFSFIGYRNEEVEVANKSKLEVSIYPDSEYLEDVLVVAYGTAKKESYSGSAALVKSETLLENPVSSFEQAMQGRVAGLQVVTSSGQPGATASFRIRGTGSLNASNEPLYVIDGVATFSESLSQVAEKNYSTSSILSSISPQDIESITVLKDAAAASLYGSRAANGVVIITTKKGKKGNGQFNISARLGVSQVPKKFDLMSSSEYYKIVFDDYYQSRMAEGYSNSDAAIWANAQTQGLITHNPYNIPQPYDANGNLIPSAQLVVNTDWQSEVLTPGLTQDYNGNFSGGTDKLNYFFSGGYYNQEGTSPTAKYKRYSGKINIDGTIKPWLKAGMNATFSYSEQNTEVAGGAGASPLYNSLYFPNGVPIYIVDDSGNCILDEYGKKQYNWINPVSKDFNPLAIPFMDISKSKIYRILTSMYMEIKFMEGLKLKTVFSPDYVNLYEIIFWNKLHGNGPAYGGRSERHQTHNLSYTSTTTLSFDKRFGDDKHGISAMIGYEGWKSTREYALAQGTMFAFDFMNELAASTNPLSPSSFTTKEVLLSEIAHVEYDYRNKYYLSGSFRRDGSSVFGENNKWGNFYSVGASWRIDQENFLKRVKWINALKLRVSYGTSGNNLGVDRYQSLGLWSAGSNYNYGSYPGFAHTQFANPDLGWEKQAMFNVGLDYELFNNKIYGSIEYFNKRSRDLLYKFPLPTSHGIENVMRNMAKVENNGFEFVLGADIVRKKNFNWNLSFNIATSTDKILDLAGNDNVVMGEYKKIWKVGYSQYEFYMPTWMGVDRETGNPLWKKGNGTTSEYGLADYELQGKSIPDAYGALTNNLSWKGLSLSFMIYYNIGGKVYDGLYASVMHEGGDAGKNLHRDGLKAWTPNNRDTDIPKYKNSSTAMSNSASTRFLYDATYIKLKNINLSYSLPKKWFSKGNILSDTKVFFNAENIYTWFKSNWKGYDDLDMYGINGYNSDPTMPLSRTFSFGINLTF